MVHDGIFRGTTSIKHPLALGSCTCNSPHLGPDVLITGRTHKREAYQEDICLRIRKGTETVIVLLPCSIPKTKRDRFSIHHNIRGVVVENWTSKISIPNYRREKWSYQSECTLPKIKVNLRSFPETIHERLTGNALVVYEIRRHVYQAGFQWVFYWVRIAEY